MPPSNLATLLVRGLSFSYGPRPILDDVSLTVAPGDRIGLVAPNGAGKSTLLRLLAGDLRPEAGSIATAPPTASIGFLAQEPERHDDETVREAVARRTGVAAATAEYDTALADVAGAPDRYAEALERWLALGGPDLDTRLAETWARLGLPARLLDQPTATLSGGEAARTSLAAVLLSRHDVLLLDEPTNDLDFAALDQLEAFVVGWEAPLVVVSHDRAFLERVTTAVVELDEHTHQVTRYEGGWAAYVDERAVARRHATEAHTAYAATRRELTDRLRRQREWATQGVARAKRNPRDGDRAQQGFFQDRTEKQASKVRRSEKALLRLQAAAPDKPFVGWDLRFEIAASARSGDMVARLAGATVDRGAFHLGPVDLEVVWGDRISIVGPNGAGKTTLLDALLGRVVLATGEHRLGPGVIVGEVDQARAEFEADAPLLRSFAAASGLETQTEARSVLAKFGLGAEHLGRPSRSLSPGERTRASLALLQARQVNCLVLDEPTNHLDLPALEQIEQAVERFTGTVLLVSHDRRLLETISTTRRLEVAAGRVRELD
jgi:ATPase subunit of ABC transporter with duplicated ATPase domains